MTSQPICCLLNSRFVPTFYLFTSNRISFCFFSWLLFFFCWKNVINKAHLSWLFLLCSLALSSLLFVASFPSLNISQSFCPYFIEHSPMQILYSPLQSYKMDWFCFFICLNFGLMENSQFIPFSINKFLCTNLKKKCAKPICFNVCVFLCG